MMTATSHNSGTERCSEVAITLSDDGEVFDAVINIQGDEPFIDPEQIREVASCLEKPDTDIATLIKKITITDELISPNVVKAVVDQSGFALYFSRSPIPFARGKDQREWLECSVYYKHIGIYGYLTPVLNSIVSLPVSNLELTESLEQLRWLDYGFRIKTNITEFESIAIDTPTDLLKITNRTGTFPG
jgi:3-deoxy-manno-octulosonate cytidylyltransferase (CMP-KDO synthetase)